MLSTPAVRYVLDFVRIRRSAPHHCAVYLRANVARHDVGPVFDAARAQLPPHGALIDTSDPTREPPGVLHERLRVKLARIEAYTLEHWSAL